MRAREQRELTRELDELSDSEKDNGCKALAMPTRKANARTYPTITRAEADAWRDLHRQLARTRTLQDANDLAAQTAPPHAKRFYTHLRAFVRTLTLPRRGTRSELYVYGKLRLRFANGARLRAKQG